MKTDLQTLPSVFTLTEKEKHFVSFQGIVWFDDTYTEFKLSLLLSVSPFYWAGFKKKFTSPSVRLLCAYVFEGVG